MHRHIGMQAWDGGTAFKSEGNFVQVCFKAIKFPLTLTFIFAIYR